MLILNTIRYMGKKNKLLNNIISAISSITPTNGIVCDLMAGSNTVSYALKEHYTVYTNDVQEYSYIISKAVIENQNYIISKKTSDKDLDELIHFNYKNKVYNFFEKTYSDSYFSKNQCSDIDAIRYAIDNVEVKEKKYLYLLALMCAMCTVQSTTGHFAQFMPSTHKRIIPLQKLSLLDEFKKKCDNYSNLFFNNNLNKCFCYDYKDLINSNKIANIDTIYLDSPYTQEQYSRFYHILETVAKYDSPNVNYKAKYRDGRFMSNFCYRNKVSDEFEIIISYCNKFNINLVISYSNKGLLPIEILISICNKYFKNVSIEDVDFMHSTQGKGNKEVKEFIILCKN